MPSNARDKVSGKRSKIRRVTGWPEIMEFPKSKRKTSQSHLTYWVLTGLSVPSLTRIASMSACEASIPATTRAGSPGITRITINTIVEMSKTVNIRRPNLLRANSKMWVSFILTLKTWSSGPGHRKLALPLLKPWSDGILERWRNGFGGIRSFLCGWQRPENKISPSSSFDSQYSIFLSDP
jgi:hypothetical protein